jgi:hypothetical protein
MSDSFVPSGQGVFSKTLALHVCDGSTGELVPAIAAWAWNPAQARFDQFWPKPPLIDAFTAVIDSSGISGDWRTVTLTWSAPQSTSVVLALGDSLETIYTGTGTSYTFNWFDADYAPGQRVLFELTAINSAGATSTQASVSVPNPPAPSQFRLVSSAYDEVVLAWTTVPGAVRYEVYKSYVTFTRGVGVDATIVEGEPVPGPATSTELVGSTTANTITLVNVEPGGRYTYQVVAVCTPSASTQPWHSAGSMSLSVAVPLRPGAQPGVYTLRPSGAGTWQGGMTGGQKAGWRPAGDDLYHGGGGETVGRGIQTGHWFYGTQFATNFPAGMGVGTVTRFQIYLTRFVNTGASAPVVSHWLLHKFTAKPAGSPVSTWGGAYDAGAVAPGKGGWVDLPVEWAVYLINAGITAGGYKGVAWGNIPARYMRAEASIQGVTTPNGTLKITVE